MGAAARCLVPLALVLLAASAAGSAAPHGRALLRAMGNESACQPRTTEPAQPAAALQIGPYGNLFAAASKTKIVRQFLISSLNSSTSQIEGYRQVRDLAMNASANATAFLMIDESWDAVGKWFCVSQDSLLGWLDTQPQFIVSYVQQHVVPNRRVPSSEFEDGMVFETFDKSVNHTLRRKGDRWVFEDASVMHGDVTIVITDIRAGNTIVHLIDTMFRVDSTELFWNKTRSDALTNKGYATDYDCCNGIPGPKQDDQAPLLVKSIVPSVLVPLALISALVLLWWCKGRHRGAPAHKGSASYSSSGGGATDTPPSSREAEGHGPIRIAWEDLELRDRIGSGAEGNVYIAHWQHTEVAAKEFAPLNRQPGSRLAPSCSDMAPLSDVSRAPESTFRREVGTLQAVSHPSLVRLIGICEESPQGPLLILDYYRKGSVWNMLRRAHSQLERKRAGMHVGEAGDLRTLSVWENRLRMLHDVAGGMAYLHSKSHVHGDLRSPNLFVAGDGKVKIGDFGFTKRLDEDTLRVRRTTHPAWVAPELLQNGELSRASDVYSFGIVMHEMLTWLQPFEGVVSELVSVRVMAGVRPHTLPDNELPPGTSAADLPAYRALMEACWDQQPDRRPSFKDVAHRLEQMLRRGQQPAGGATTRTGRAAAVVAALLPNPSVLLGGDAPPSRADGKDAAPASFSARPSSRARLLRAFGSARRASTATSATLPQLDPFTAAAARQLAGTPSGAQSEPSVGADAPALAAGPDAAAAAAADFAPPAASGAGPIAPAGASGTSGAGGVGVEQSLGPFGALALPEQWSVDAAVAAAGTAPAPPDIEQPAPAAAAAAAQGPGRGRGFAAAMRRVMSPRSVSAPDQPVQEARPPPKPDSRGWLAGISL